MHLEEVPIISGYERADGIDFTEDVGESNESSRMTSKNCFVKWLK